MKRTTLSVGIPSYNEANTIATVLSTVLCEPLPPGCELVSTVISDCSTDATPEILERFTIARPDFIKVIHHTFRTGLNLAINEIFENANTDFLLYINADSLPAAGSISSLVESMLSDESVGAVSAAMIPVPVGQSFVERAGVFGAGVFQRLRESSRSFHGRMFMIRGKLARKVRLPVDAIEQDAFISCSIREMGFRVEYLRSAICYYSPPSTLRDYVLPNRLYRIETCGAIHEGPAVQVETHIHHLDSFCEYGKRVSP